MANPENRDSDSEKYGDFLAGEPEAPPLRPSLFEEKPLLTRILLWFAPNLTAFIASFCIMVLELVAGRIIARYLGSSLYTWTSVIGVVLAGITIGNLIGGRLADWFKPASVLAVLFLLASGACVTITLVNDWVYRMNWSPAPGQANPVVWALLWVFGGDDGKLPWSGRIFGHVFIVFLLPSTLLGMIGPVVAKMALDQGRQIGRTVGNVYAWGALGSIVGTFVTGFWLIALMGTVPVVLCVGIVLGLMGIIYSLSRLWPAASAGGAAAAVLTFLSFLWAYAIPVAAVISFFAVHDWKLPFEAVERGGRMVLREKLASDEKYVEESQYTYMRVDSQSETVDGVETETRRDLVMDSLIHAELVPGDPTNLQYEYEKIYQAVTHKFMPEDVDKGKDVACLFLGGGGYVFPRYLRATWPEVYIEVAEIDPAVTEADVNAFELDKDKIQIVQSPKDLQRTDNPYWIYHMDARNHVDDIVPADPEEKLPAARQFDFVYGDAFNFLGVPYHLTTKEFNRKIRRLLKPDRGIYLINIIDIFKSGKFLGAIYNTFRETFGENVYVFCNNDNEPDKEGRDTYIVIGSLRPLDLSGLPQSEVPYTFTGSLLSADHLKELEENSDHLVLSDDYAPVENLLEYVVNRWKS